MRPTARWAAGGGAYRRHMRFLLRPGWLAFIVVVLGFVAACYTFLAPWQFDREAQREAEQARIDTAAATAPVDVAALVPGAGVPADAEWRQVVVTGTYLPEAEALVRLRVADAKPAYEVLTPVRLADGRIVAVDRGSIPADPQVTPVVPAPPAGTVSLLGRLRLNETDPGARAPLDVDGTRQIYAADSRSLASVSGLEIVEGYVQLMADQPGVLSALPVTPAASGAPFSNFSYALQWLTFGLIALLALGYFVRLEVLQRQGRRDAARTRKAAFRDALAGRDAPEGAGPADDSAARAHRDAEDTAPSQAER